MKRLRRVTAIDLGNSTGNVCAHVLLNSAMGETNTTLDTNAAG